MGCIQKQTPSTTSAVWLTKKLAFFYFFNELFRIHSIVVILNQTDTYFTVQPCKFSLLSARSQNEATSVLKLNQTLITDCPAAYMEKKILSKDAFFKMKMHSGEGMHQGH